MLIESVGIKAHVLGMNVEQVRFELPHRFAVVDMLPHKMGGVEVEPEIGAGNVVEHTPPYRRRDGEILATGPLVFAEGHGAILDAYADAMILRKRDQRTPGTQEPWPVGVDGFCPIATDERVHHGNLQLLGGKDDGLDVLDVDRRFGLVRSQWIRIVTEP